MSPPRIVEGPNPLVHVVVVALMGLGWITFAHVQWTRTKDFISTAAHANGRIVRLREHPHPDGGTYRSPVVEFTTAHGETRRFESFTCVADLSVGGDVAVLYSEAEPKHAEIDSPRAMWWGPTIMYVAGACCIGLALVFWWGTARHRE